jgi:hypothetical protein
VSYSFMVGYQPARGLYTLLTNPDLVGHNLLGNLCKGHVASLCNHTSVVWYGALQTPHGWVQISSAQSYEVGMFGIKVLGHTSVVVVRDPGMQLCWLIVVVG